MCVFNLVHLLEQHRNNAAATETSGVLFFLICRYWNSRISNNELLTPNLIAQHFYTAASSFKPAKTRQRLITISRTNEKKRKLV
jgi:hypothetical protein